MPDRLSPAMRTMLLLAIDRQESGAPSTRCRWLTARELSMRGLAERWYSSHEGSHMIWLTPAGRAEARRIREEEQRA